MSRDIRVIDVPINVWVRYLMTSNNPTPEWFFMEEGVSYLKNAGFTRIWNIYLRTNVSQCQILPVGPVEIEGKKMMRFDFVMFNR